MEIITGVERRRRWRLEEKLRIVAETEQPGAGIAEIARRYEISRGLLWNWRSQVRRGVLKPEPPPVSMSSVRSTVCGRATACHPANPGRTARRLSRAMDASRTRQAVAPRRCREGDGLHAQTVGGVHSLPARWTHLSHKQRGRTRAARCGARQEELVVRRQ